MKELTCIICPRGCKLTVNDDMNVTGNFCPRGKDYAISELTHPVRTITSSVRVINKEDTLVSVKTSKPISKDKIFDLMKFINGLKVQSPCKIGDIIASNPLGLDTEIVITKNID